MNNDNQLKQIKKTLKNIAAQTNTPLAIVLEKFIAEAKKHSAEDPHIKELLKIFPSKTAATFPEVREKLMRHAGIKK